MSTKNINYTIQLGTGLGTALATVVSYNEWDSIPWAILHGIFGWFYVIYYAIVY